MNFFKIATKKNKKGLNILECVDKIYTRVFNVMLKNLKGEI